MAPQTADTAALSITDRAGVQTIVFRLSTTHTGLWPCGQTATCSPGLPFNGLHPCNQCNYMDYYSVTDPKGMEG